MFDSLIPDAQGFLRGLAQNNTRDWFLAHKKDYDSKLRDPARALLDELTPRLTALTGYPTTGKLFRPHRDVRFSKDKSPYNTHLHMMWMVQSGARQDPALFFGIDPDKITVATGMMEFDKAVLADWRKMADGDAAYLRRPIDAAQDKGFTLWEPALKRVPPPYAKDHPQYDLLRHKGLVIAGQPDLTGDLATRLAQAYADIWPVADMLVGVAEAPVL